jgi:hypothetical protein
VKTSSFITPAEMHTHPRAWGWLGGSGVPHSPTSGSHNEISHRLPTTQIDTRAAQLLAVWKPLAQNGPSGLRLQHAISPVARPLLSP